MLSASMCSIRHAQRNSLCLLNRRDAKLIQTTTGWECSDPDLVEKEKCRWVLVLTEGHRPLSFCGDLTVRPIPVAIAAHGKVGLRNGLCGREVAKTRYQNGQQPIWCARV